MTQQIDAACQKVNETGALFEKNKRLLGDALADLWLAKQGPTPPITEGMKASIKGLKNQLIDSQINYDLSLNNLLALTFGGTV